MWSPPHGDLCAASNVCLHRGASLVDGGTVTDAGGLRCCYHGRAAFGRDVVVVDQGFAWYGWGVDPAGEDYAAPRIPTCPEFTAPGYRTFAYSKTIPVNPVLMAENTLDWAHLAGDVHRVKFIEGTPRVSIRPPSGGHGFAAYTYDTTTPYDLTVENEFWAPFTTCLRFRFRHKATGAIVPPLLLWFSLEPSGTTESVLHLRVARGIATHPALDCVFRLIDELPLNEDAWLVKNMYPGAWSSNALTIDDTFVATYRDVMAARYVDLLAAYVG